MKRVLNASGMTLIELLIVISVMGVLAGVVVAGLNPIAQINKANDAKRKTHLTEVQKALELYYQDNQRYPEASNNRIAPGGVQINWGDVWTSYISRLPVDPNTSKTYVYITDAEGQSYWLFASLDNWRSDAQACVPNATTNTQCSFQTSGSCGSGFICNYGKSSSNVTPH